jgi:hypothetical protein
MLSMPRNPTGPAPDGNIQFEDADEAEDIEDIDDSGRQPWELGYKAL